jgi:hypothetical protein
MSFTLIILWIALNAAPARITSFTLTSTDKQAVEYAKQADGGWKAVAAGQRSDSTIYFTKTELTIATAEGKKISFPAAETLGLKGDAWQTAESLSFGRGVLKIQRQADGLDLFLDSPDPKTPDNAQQKYTIRWKEMPDKNDPKKAEGTVPGGTKAN